MDKLDLFINRRIVELEAAKRGVTVTPLEVAAGVNEDLQTTGLQRDDFVRVLQSRYGKTLYEWENDVVRQRLLLGKMARVRVTVSEEEARQAFESKHGERREAFVIKWPKAPNPLSEDVKKLVLEKPEEFEKLAKEQPNELKDNGGRTRPVGRHLVGEDPRVEQALFGLKNPGDAAWVETEATSTCVKLIKVIPPDPVKFEDVRGAVEKEVADRKLSFLMPLVFDEVRKAANPQLTTAVPPRPPADPNTPPAPRVQHPDPKVLAVLYGTTPVTRTDLGEFLIARGGYEKLDSLINIKIVEIEAAKRSVTASPEEIEAALQDDLKSIGEKGVTKEDFVSKILPVTKKTLTEYVEDEVRPRLLLGKMVKDKVQVTDDDLKKAFERHYGEKRLAKIILWGKDEFRRANKEWNEARQSDEAFARVARAQTDPNLAAAGGAIKPIGRHGDAPNPLIERVVFSLKEGELSELFQTPAGILCLKCVGTVPPAAGVTFESVKPALEKEVYAQKLNREIPALFAQLRQAANPNLILRGPPTERENQEGVMQIINQVGGPAPKQ
jgi:parvulin-like peptidyl-prolyl isomerase